MLNHAEILLTSTKPKTCTLNQPTSDKPMRILVLGDFSGQRQKTSDSQKDYCLIEKVDIDNFASNSRPSNNFFILRNEEPSGAKYPSAHFD